MFSNDDEVHIYSVQNHTQNLLLEGELLALRTSMCYFHFYDALLFISQDFESMGRDQLGGSRDNFLKTSDSSDFTVKTFNYATIQITFLRYYLI